MNKRKEKRKKGFILVSVFDKRGIAKFAKTLNSLGYEIISTEGTGKELTKNEISYIPAQKISKNPDGLNDCIKTISFCIEAGILFDRSNAIHLKEARNLGIKQIDMVICNFPPLEKVIKNPNIDFNIRNIDVGGPLMVRAAATNFKHVLVVVDPNDYEKVSKAILEDRVTDKLRQQLAVKAFTYTYSYDYKIAKYLKKNNINFTNNFIKKARGKFV
jgi:phosphoribosylaminoimidazolecarboxamide formyltransferase/IMP cyclohydrolase